MEVEWPAERIRKLRSTLGLSQQEFARKIGVRRVATVSDWENGNKRPSPLSVSNLQRLERRARK